MAGKIYELGGQRGPGPPSGLTKIEMWTTPDVAMRIATQVNQAAENQQQQLLIMAALLMRLGSESPWEFGQEELLAAAPLASNLNRRGMDGVLTVYDKRLGAPPIKQPPQIEVDSGEASEETPAGTEEPA